MLQPFPKSRQPCVTGSMVRLYVGSAMSQPPIGLDNMRTICIPACMSIKPFPSSCVQPKFRGSKFILVRGAVPDRAVVYVNERISQWLSLYTRFGIDVQVVQCWIRPSCRLRLLSMACKSSMLLVSKIVHIYYCFGTYFAET